MKLNMKEKKILYAYACPSHHNTVTRLKWLTALTVDPETKSQMGTLFVTKIMFSDLACAAINISNGPIGVPLF